MAGSRIGMRTIQRLFYRPVVGETLDGFENTEFHIASSTTPGHQIRVIALRPGDANGTLPAMLYVHGGGMAVGTPEMAFPFFEDVLNRRDVVIISPVYRLSLDHPFPAGFDDVYDTLLWMRDNADELGIYPDRLMVAGHSAGGGLTAAVTQKARDTGDVDIAFQMPIYPMIDHTQSTESAMNMRGATVWDTDASAFAWQLYLRDREGEAVPAYASPAANDDFSGFPPTISFVGDLEPFYDETVAYMMALAEAGVPTRFRVFERAFHGFETIAPDTTMGRAGNAFQLEAFEDFFDYYVNR